MEKCPARTGISGSYWPGLVDLVALGDGMSGDSGSSITITFYDSSDGPTIAFDTEALNELMLVRGFSERLPQNCELTLDSKSGFLLIGFDSLKLSIASVRRQTVRLLTR